MYTLFVCLFFQWRSHKWLLPREIPVFLLPKTTLGILCIKFFIYLAKERLYPRANNNQQFWDQETSVTVLQIFNYSPSLPPDCLLLLIPTVLDLRIPRFFWKTFFLLSFPPFSFSSFLSLIFFSLFLFLYFWERTFLSFNYRGFQVLQLWGDYHLLHIF